MSLNRDEAGQLWLSNHHLQARLGAHGVEQLEPRQGDGWGEPLLAQPMALKRYADRGEFWDAWDIAADYRTHSLEVRPLREVQVLEAGPLVGHLALRFRVGLSTLRLDLRLRRERTASTS